LTADTVKGEKKENGTSQEEDVGKGVKLLLNENVQMRGDLD